MFKRLFSVGLIVSYAFAAEPAIGDIAVCVGNKVRVSLYSSNPLADMRLSPYPLHQRPPIFMVTLPHGQRIIFLGTTHTFPLSCMLPYWVARELIELSTFSFNEINGSLLKSGCRKIDDPSDEEDIPEYVAVKEDDRAKIEAGERTFYEKWYAGDKLKEKAAESMASVFGSDGSWYKKAGLLKRDDALGQIVRMLPANKELHPAALSYAYKALTGSSSYQKPSCGGMDDHLDHILSVNYGRTLYALEENNERFGEGFLKENRITLQESITSGCQNVISYGVAVECLLRDVDGVKQVVNIESIDPSGFFSGDLRETESLDVLERDDLWVPRIMALNTEYFNLAFGYVGCDHLVDLFKKLWAAGCHVSAKLSLVDLAEILLDEPAILREHARLKAIYKHL